MVGLKAGDWLGGVQGFLSGKRPVRRAGVWGEQGGRGRGWLAVSHLPHLTRCPEPTRQQRRVRQGHARLGHRATTVGASGRCWPPPEAHLSIAPASCVGQRQPVAVAQACDVFRVVAGALVTLTPCSGGPVLLGCHGRLLK